MEKDDWIIKGKRSVATYTTADEHGLALAVEVPHWRDDLYASRGGALLGYSAIMIAAALVYLSADPASFLSTRASAPECAHISFWSLGLFFVSSIFSLFSIVRPFGSRSSKDGPVTNLDEFWIRLGKLEAFNEQRKMLQGIASAIAMLGSVLLLYSLVGSTYFGACY